MKVEQMKESKKTKVVTEALNRLLADTFVLYFKTHAYHWNVEGPNFASLHGMFMEQYTDLWQSLDDIAERLRAVDAYAPVSVKELMKQAQLAETGQHRDHKQMVKDLAEDNAAISQSLSDLIRQVQDAGDEGTADLFINRQKYFDKTAWMLRATAA